MSTVHEDVDLDVGDLTEAVPGKTTAQTDIFDLKTLGDAELENLRTFKQMRSELKTQRSKIDAQIKVLDKRIEMVLNNLKTLQTPV